MRLLPYTSSRRITRVEDHLCEEHTQEQAGLLGDGLMEILQESGLSDGKAFKEIPAAEPPTPCFECGRPARYASLTLASTMLCGEHKGLA